MKLHTVTDKWTVREQQGYDEEKIFDILYDDRVVAENVYSIGLARQMAASGALLEAAELALKIAEGWIESEPEGTSSVFAAIDLQQVREAIASARGE